MHIKINSLYRFIALKEEQSLPGLNFVWEYILSALNISAALAFVFYPLISFSQTYSQLTVGSITWRMASKGQDYLLALYLLAATPIIYISIYWLSRLIRKRHGSQFEAVFRRFCGYAVLPSILWLGIELAGIYSDNWLILLSFFLEVVILGVGILWTTKSLRFASKDDYAAALRLTLLTVLFYGFSSLAIVLAIGRINVAWHIDSFDKLLGFATLITLLALFLVFLTWFLSRRSTALLRQLSILFLSSQLCLPLFFTILMPPPWEDFQGKFQGYEFNNTLTTLTIALIAVGYIDWLLRFRCFLKNEAKGARSSLLSHFCLLATLLFIKQIPQLSPVLSPDDYHFGELILPWWLSDNFQYIPFQDYEPARGLVNYFPGLLLDVFFDGTAGAFSAFWGQSLMILPFLGLGLLVIGKSIGLFPTVIALLLMPNANGILEIYFLLTAALCFLCDSFLSRRWTLWLLYWLIIGTVLVLFAPGQGALFVISMMPLGAFAFYKAITREKQKLIYATLFSFLSFAVVCWLTPLDYMILGAVRYLIEQSSINSTSYGVEWPISQNSNGFLGYLLWEAVRTSWIFVGITTALLFCTILLNPRWPSRERFLVFAVPILLSSFLWIPRAIGRIDAGTASRMGIASVWFICFLLPIILVIAYPSRQKHVLFLLPLLISGVLTSSSLLSNPPIVKDVLTHPVQTVDVNPVALVNGADFGLPNLGYTALEPDHLARLQSIKNILKQILDEDETYLDLTNRNAQYFYLNYPVPISVGAIYNLVNEKQQQRAIQRLELADVSVVLALADNLNFDGGTVSLRSHLLYRYLVDKFIPVSIDDFIFMVKPSKLERVRSFLELESNFTGFLDTQLSEPHLQLLDRVFHNPDLQYIPSAWGQSFSKLRSQLEFIQDIDVTTDRSRQVESVSVDRYKLNSFSVSGKDAGLLSLDIACKSKALPIILNLSWQNNRIEESGNNTSKVQFSAETGRILFPLDAEPRWLLSEGVTNIVIELANVSPCRAFSIRNAQLFQRQSVGRASRSTDKSGI